MHPRRTLLISPVFFLSWLLVFPYLTAQARHSEQRTMERSRGRAIRAVAFFPGGASLAGADEWGRIVIWNTETGESKRVFETCPQPPPPAALIPWVRSVALSPGGKTLAALTAFGNVTLWDTESGALIRTLRASDQLTGSPLQVFFSSDGSALTYVDSTGLEIWDTTTWDERVIPGNADLYLGKSATVSPGGRFVADVGPGGEVRMWDLQSGSVQKPFHMAGSVREVKAVAFSPDGKALVVAGSGNPSWALDLAAAMLSGDAGASAGEAGKLSLWDVQTGQRKRIVTRGFGTSYPRWTSLAFSADGSTLAAGSENGEVFVFGARTLRQKRKLKDGSTVTLVTLSANGKLLASVTGDTVTVWRLD